MYRSVNNTRNEPQGGENGNGMEKDENSALHKLFFNIWSIVQLNVKVWFRARGVLKLKGHSEGRDTDAIFVQERVCHSSETVSSSSWRTIW